MKKLRMPEKVKPLRSFEDFGDSPGKRPIEVFLHAREESARATVVKFLQLYNCTGDAEHLRMAHYWSTHMRSAAYFRNILHPWNATYAKRRDQEVRRVEVKALEHGVAIDGADRPITGAS